ncbi:hypothetical protein, conserved [Angomonas deanei]|uniref:Uncharacterized protein n=1 Tax=Angomonas deanei TaxID=59799 RepID=A0A7G2C4I6_9TRYP|nr:hypothetical protein, conserved [Angomonas deanei]
MSHQGSSPSLNAGVAALHRNNDITTPQVSNRFSSQSSGPSAAQGAVSNEWDSWRVTKTETPKQELKAVEPSPVNLPSPNAENRPSTTSTEDKPYLNYCQYYMERLQTMQRPFVHDEYEEGGRDIVAPNDRRPPRSSRSRSPQARRSSSRTSSHGSRRSRLSSVEEGTGRRKRSSALRLLH